MPTLTPRYWQSTTGSSKISSEQVRGSRGRSRDTHLSTPSAATECGLATGRNECRLGSVSAGSDRAPWRSVAALRDAAEWSASPTRCRRRYGNPAARVAPTHTPTVSRRCGRRTARRVFLPAQKRARRNARHRAAGARRRPRGVRSSVQEGAADLAYRCSDVLGLLAANVRKRSSRLPLLPAEAKAQRDQPGR